jgi:transcriptional regulator CtsR
MKWSGEGMTTLAKKSINAVSEMIAKYALSIPKVISTRVHYDIINLKFADESILTIKLIEGKCVW